MFMLDTCFFVLYQRAGDISFPAFDEDSLGLAFGRDGVPAVYFW